MITPKLNDPYTWSPGFVATNRVGCLQTLRMFVTVAEDYLREGDYLLAATSMKRLSAGLIKLEDQNFGDFGKQEVLLAMMMPMVTVLGLLCKDAPENRRRDAALTYAMGIATDPDHEFAACYPIAEKYVLSFIRDLKSGMPLDAIIRKYNFPADVFDSLRSLDQDIAASYSGSAAPSAAYTSSAASEPALPGKSTKPPVHTRKRGKRRRFGQATESFEEWMESYGIREDNLDEVTQRVKLRRNIYGVLSFCTPLGLILLPFWYAAVMLTKMLQTRDLDAEPGALCKFLFGVYAVGTLFLPAFFLLYLVSWSKWGMGMGTRASRVLNTLFWGSLLLFILWQMTSSAGPISFIVGAALLAVFLVIYWCRRAGSPVPALVLGGLSVAALAGFLIFGRVNITGKDTVAQGGGELSRADRCAMAQSMLDVLDVAIANNEYGKVGLADVDGDGIKELLVAYEPTALLYDWQNDSLTSKEIHTQSTGIFYWWLCQDTKTGDCGFMYEDQGDDDIAYYYPSYEVHIGELPYYDSSTGTSREYYYIDNHEHEVTKEYYQEIRRQHRDTESLPTYSWFDFGQEDQSAFIRAELEAIRDGKTLQYISDEGLLERARELAYAPGDMGFALDMGDLIPQDEYDYIIVNMEDWPIEENEIHAHRALDCTTGAEVKSVVQAKWNQTFSRRYPLEYTPNVIEYTGQPGNYGMGDLLQYKGALYVIGNLGVGDEGIAITVDWMISRTEDEAIFQAHTDYGEYTFSLIYEDETWKYGRDIY